MPFITLTTDFGTDSPYVAQIKAAILCINPDASLVDITHAIAPQNVRAGALVLDEVAPRFPPDTIHVAVVDPGVGTERQLVFARIGKQNFLAPDNGLLSALTRTSPAEQLVALTDRQYWAPAVSATFHGRDILAPVAAHLSLGLEPARLGRSLRQIHALPWPRVHVGDSRIEGEVCRIDSFGNLITDITADLLGEAESDRLVVTCGTIQIDGLVTTYANRSEATLVALIGSSGRLELAVVGGSASHETTIGVGQPVTVSW